MELEDQIIYTKKELDSYKENKFSSPEIIKWLEAIYESLCRLYSLEK